MRHTYSDNRIISPRTQSAIMNICVGNNESITDWEDGITCEDIDIAFATVGENPNIKQDEFVIGENDDNDDESFEPGNHMKSDTNVM